MAPYEEGITAYKAGTLREHNPYSIASDSNSDWLSGWECARQEYIASIEEIFWPDTAI